MSLATSARVAVAIAVLSAAACESRERGQAVPVPESQPRPEHTILSGAHGPATAPQDAHDRGTAPLRNRLGEETSPYLLQHRENPVAWFAWGPEAFETARALDRPIFLSVGYSTCYWCHVMERESFENEAIAAIMNEHFVCIKVDREERPDVDDIYMSAVQLLTHHGGWPMSVFLEPQALRPFLGGTYFPPEDLPGRPGFASVLRHVAELWASRRQDVLRQAGSVASAVSAHLAAPVQPGEPARDTVDLAISTLMAGYDPWDGGFTGGGGRAPKFPIASTLDFLIGAGWESAEVQRALVHTLDRMATGGLYDQVGGGFHRYSTDAQWLLPHFEKMLYDNGQLASTYAAVFQRTGDAFHAAIVRRTLEYVLREMTLASGAFASAQDAETDHREGLTYLWRAAQVRAALEAAGRGDLVEFALEIYGFKRGENFEDPHHPEDGRWNVVHLIERPDALAGRLGLDPAAFDERRSAVNAILLAARDTRLQPMTDDKVLAAWNGLMIAGMADGGRVLGERRFIDAAARAADFVLRAMRSPGGGLLRTSRGGIARIDAFAEDYAAMIRGLIALHRASGEAGHLQAAEDLAAVMARLFRDDSSGGYYDTLAGRSDLFVRARSTYDGAVPCANSQMALNLIDLHELSGRARYLDDARALLAFLSPVLGERPGAPVLAALALHRLPATVAASAPAAAQQPSDPVRRPSLAAPAKPVLLAVNPGHVTLALDQPVTCEVTLTIAAGHHINSSKPGIDFLIPLQIALVDGEGIRLEVAYPPGEPYAGPEGAMVVHHGTVTIPLRLERVGEVGGRPRLTIRYQACTDRMCLGPETERLPIGILMSADR